MGCYHTLRSQHAHMYEVCTCCQSTYLEALTFNINLDGVVMSLYLVLTHNIFFCSRLLVWSCFLLQFSTTRSVCYIKYFPCIVPSFLMTSRGGWSPYGSCVLFSKLTPKGEAKRVCSVHLPKVARVLCFSLFFSYVDHIYILSRASSGCGTHSCCGP